MAKTNPVYGKMPVERGFSQSRDATVDLVYSLQMCSTVFNLGHTVQTRSTVFENYIWIGVTSIYR
jgi:hypothetical protein